MKRKMKKLINKSNRPKRSTRNAKIIKELLIQHDLDFDSMTRELLNILNKKQ